MDTVQLNVVFKKPVCEDSVAKKEVCVPIKRALLDESRSEAPSLGFECLSCVSQAVNVTVVLLKDGLVLLWMTT